MERLRFESPLVWPEWQPATPRASQRNDHGLTAPVTLDESITFLEQELEALAVTGILYLDIEQPRIDRLRKKVGSRTGACLQFRYHDKGYVLACDRWLMTEHNIYALHLALRQWRTIERWGVGDMELLLRSFSTGMPVTGENVGGFVPEWMHEFGLGPTATLDDAIAVYHRRAKQAAQDSDTLSRLNGLIEEAREYFAGRTGL